MSGIVDVAAAVGVSPATVSRALRGLPGVSEQNRQRIQMAAAQLGYVASPWASALPTGKTNAVGILVPWISRWFFNAVVEGCQGVVAKHGFDLVLYAAGTSKSLPHRIDTRVLSKRVDGVLALSVNLHEQEIKALEESRCPLVTVGRAGASLNRVQIDDVEVGRKATEYLIGLGHTRIAFFGGDPYDIFGFPVAPDRLNGFVTALRTAGLVANPDWVIGAEFSVAGGEAAFEELWSRPDRPTAIVAASDEIAMGILHRARLHGVPVPEALSVVGVDDHDLAYLFGLTTVSQPVRREGQLAAELLLKRMTIGPTMPAECIMLPTTLIERQTTGPAPH